MDLVFIQQSCDFICQTWRHWLLQIWTATPCGAASQHPAFETSLSLANWSCANMQQRSGWVNQSPQTKQCTDDRLDSKHYERKMFFQIIYCSSTVLWTLLPDHALYGWISVHAIQLVGRPQETWWRECQAVILHHGSARYDWASRHSTAACKSLVVWVLPWTQPWSYCRELRPTLILLHVAQSQGVFENWVLLHSCASSTLVLLLVPSWFL